ncbi:MAG: DUF1800 family protein [Hyphomicrobiaceae bacterium]
MSQRAAKPGDASTATRRFGLGPKPGDLARIASDPRGYVLAMLSTPGEALIAKTPPLRSTPEVFTENDDVRIEQAILRTFGNAGAAVPAVLPTAPVAAGMGPPPPPPARVAVEPPPTPAQGMAGGDPNMMMGEAPQPTAKVNFVGKLRQDMLTGEAIARIKQAVATQTPLLERLVYFWSNHFCVSAAKGDVRALVGPLEREAIRPHVLGKFADMLRAVEQHPAMLIYLDNTLSVGPNAFVAIGRVRGLNENLAREILELHTLGADGGYSQTDVTSLAKVITGWTYGHGEYVSEAEYGRFIFTPYRHEPGPFEVVGKTYAQPGVAAGEAVLADLALHPSTARHLARKLARHFVSDNPPPELVARLERTFLASGGDLSEVTRVLIASDEAWDAPPAKILPPFDFCVSLARGLAAIHPGEIGRLCSVLGQPVWTMPSPKGWPDADDSWMSPSPIRERLRIAEKIAREIKTGDPRLVLDDLGGPGVSEHTRQAVQRAETREQAFELMMMSPEFLRR